MKSAKKINVGLSIIATIITTTTLIITIIAITTITKMIITCLDTQV